MRCLIWAAVSTRPQANEETKDSIPSQIAAARELIERNEGWHEVTEPLVIPGESRSRHIFLEDIAQEIPQYTELMALAREGQIDLVICRSRDRLARTDSVIATLEGYLAHHGVQVLSLSMPTRVLPPDEFKRTQDRASVWLRSVERARAADEILEIKSRYQMGMRRRVSSGLHPGSPPYGYEVGEDGIGEIVEAEATVIKLIFSWFLQGESFRQIGFRLKKYATCRIPSSQYMNQIIQNPYYCGKVTFGRLSREDYLIAPGKHEAIISEEDWSAAQRELQLRREQGKRRPYSNHPLTGSVFCAACGGPMWVASRMTYKDTAYAYYRCVAGCGVKGGYQVKKLEAQVVEVLSRWMKDREVLEQYVEETQRESSAVDEAKQLRAALAQTERAMAVWTADYELGLLGRSEYYEHRLRLEDRAEAIKRELAEIESRRLEPERVMTSLDELAEAAGERLAEWFADPSKARKLKAIFRRMGLRVVVDLEGRTVQIGLSL